MCIVGTKRKSNREECRNTVSMILEVKRLPLSLSLMSEHTSITVSPRCIDKLRHQFREKKYSVKFVSSFRLVFLLGQCPETLVSVHRQETVFTRLHSHSRISGV